MPRFAIPMLMTALALVACGGDEAPERNDDADPSAVAKGHEAAGVIACVEDEVESYVPAGNPPEALPAWLAKRIGAGALKPATGAFVYEVFEKLDPTFPGTPEAPSGESIAFLFYPTPKRAERYAKAADLHQDNVLVFRSGEPGDLAGDTIRGCIANPEEVLSISGHSARDQRIAAALAVFLRRNVNEWYDSVAEISVAEGAITAEIEGEVGGRIAQSVCAAVGAAGIVDAKGEHAVVGRDGSVSCPHR